MTKDGRSAAPRMLSIGGWLVGAFVRSGINAAPASIAIKVDRWRTVGCPGADGRAIGNEVIIVAAHVVKQSRAGGIGDIATLAGAAAIINDRSSSCNVVLNSHIAVAGPAAAGIDHDPPVGVVANVVGDARILQ